MKPKNTSPKAKKNFLSSSVMFDIIMIILPSLSVLYSIRMRSKENEIAVAEMISHTLNSPEFAAVLRSEYMLA